MGRRMRIFAGLMAGILLAGSVEGMNVFTSTAEEQWKVSGADVAAWKDAITEALGEDVIAGAAMTHSESMDDGVMELIEKHCNAVTFGNELKPDCMFGYSNDTVPGTEEIEFNGQTMVVPVPTFTKADQMLRKLKRWNDAHPDQKVRVRGHVLLWHSQTPEWFFHEDYDKKKDYVDKETMNLRLEWYIMTVLNHFLGEESEYKDMFYGWDVVNEAASDSSNVYRHDDENGNDELSDSTHGSKSSWWHVYQSNEFIINAFKYANKYAPADLELYYNDYNEIVPNKREHIKELLQAVKDADGPAGEGTRIDAFGIQGHYSISGFDLNEFETSAREYAAIVGKVQLTELDMKASSSFDGSPTAKENEYVAQAFMYQSIFDSIKKLKEEGVDFSGITFWGTVDKYSWLQSSSNVGGGADGKQLQCPLLFDDDYKVKPAFWAFVNPDAIVPPTKRIQAFYGKEIDFAKKTEYEASQGSITIKLIPLWNEEGLWLQVQVSDIKTSDDDTVTVFVDETNGGDSFAPIIQSMKRSECKGISGGYKAEFLIPITDICLGKTIRLDVRVDKKNETVSFNDFTSGQEQTGDRYARLIFAPEIYRIAKGTVTVDGDKEDAWELSNPMPMMTSSGANARGSVRVLWDNDNLYVCADIRDADVNSNDSVLICIDETNDKQPAYDKNDMAYEVNTQGEITLYGAKAKEDSIKAVVKPTEDGYIYEAAIAWYQLTPKVHGLAGTNVVINDADETGAVRGKLAFALTDEACTTDASLLGVAKFAPANKEKQEEIELLPEGVVNAVTQQAEESIAATEEAQGEQKEESENDMTVFMLLCLAAVIPLGILASRERKTKSGQKGADKKEKK